MKVCSASRILGIAVLIFAGAAKAEDCTITEENGDTVLSQYLFSWTVDGVGHSSGRFANGDCWIVGPVTILDIQPASVSSGGWTKNGSQLNPTGGNGYDSTMDYNQFDSSLNVSPNATGHSLSVTTGSIVSTVSKSSQDNRPQLEHAAVLTVLGSTPPARAFRPPYFGENKTILGTADQLDYSFLRRLAPVPATLPLEEVESKFERVWIEQNTSWSGRYMHPAKNQPDYGREIARELGHGLMSLHLNYTNAEKETLYIRLVQYGIDVYGAASKGALWEDLGGHNQGRKMPLMLAGRALNNPTILTYADAGKHFIFQEDRQTWYVTQADVGRVLYTADGRTRDQYIQSDVGIAEWGEQHTKQPQRDGRNWGVSYRNIVGSSLIGHIISAKLAGVESIWNHPPLFDYIDRFYRIEKAKVGSGLNDLQPFEAQMYADYIDGVPEDTFPQPSVNPSGGVFFSPPEVSLSASEGSKIYFTLDGTVPTSDATEYSAPIKMTATTTVKAIAIKSSGEVSPIVEETFILGDEAVIVSDENWGNSEIPSQNDVFKMTFTLVASGDNIDGVTGLSAVVIDDGVGYKGLATIVRFNQAGTIDARNGSAYESDIEVGYSGGKEYRISMIVDVPAGTYSVSVTPEGQQTVEIARNFLFRVEQANVARLNNLAYVTLGKDSHTISEVKIEPVGERARPRPPTGVQLKQD